SSSGPNITSTSSPRDLAVRLVTLGMDARRAVSSMPTFPFATNDPERKVKEEMCPSPTARRLRIERQPPLGAFDWSGCRTTLGLNKAEASKEYSCRKYAPTRYSWVLVNAACGSN